MESIRGKTALAIDAAGLAARQGRYPHTCLDIGTGDGHFVRALAKLEPDWFVIGMDACRENLRRASRSDLPNVVYLIGSAQALPIELAGRADRLTINFPWGSLLGSLLTGDPALMGGLLSVSRPGAKLEVRLNAEALSGSGTNLSRGTATISQVFEGCGAQVRSVHSLGPAELLSFPSTWAHRLAFGRDPRALTLELDLPGSVRQRNQLEN